ncbi:hypothetical protein P691DRAFT_722769 [Macrolepiota fuliginosa MF-IS2]|uniref:Manganese/iron superoxide dismutase C-terminal domain-containing protein n=1 Tax=Macrolepiota fuliginosa MF-IS2 TaxID=1400762 RepID=A0A9P6C4N6_9AGAR|nr:hypothetical protein P691DRAFT_722769 [Macrolepiota fuliginosa MF-IS2]
MNQLGLRLTSASVRVSASSSAPRFKSRWGTRRLHQRQSLPYPAEEGLGKFLPPDALKVQLEYQDGLLERLNEQVVGTGDASSSIAQTVINLSGKRDRILAFNYASLALNNSFFLNNLKPPSNNTQTHEDGISSDFISNIRTSHGSIQQLRSAFSAAALGMFINGWVWFVSDQAGNTGIVSTYGAGTLLIRSRSYMQKHPNILDSPDPSSRSEVTPLRSPFAQNPPPGTSPASPLSGISGNNSPPTGVNPLHPRFFHDDLSSITTTAAGIHSTPSGPTRRSRTSTMLHAGEILYPLFCVPVYEHAWMSAGYGIWGKEQWLKEFWSVLDWQKVDAAYFNILEAAKEKRN